MSGIDRHRNICARSVQVSFGRKRFSTLLFAVLAATAVSTAEAAHAKGGSSVDVIVTSRTDGSVISGVVSIANGGSKPLAVASVEAALEVRYASDSAPPPLPAGLTSGWYRVGRVTLPAPLSVPANGTVVVPFAIDTCGGSVAAYPGAKDMRSVARVSAAGWETGRSANFALPAKCAVCGNGIREAGEQCDVGNANGGSCCTAACQFRSNGSVCSDGDACTQVDQCDEGTCVGGVPLTCAPVDECHVAGVCNAATGTCSTPAKSNGSPCDDRNGCTQRDTCQSGTCRGADPVVCAASNSCVDASCDPSSGSCSSQPRPNGSECMDGDACSVGDNCQAGECISGAARDCDDHLSCTDDVCDETTGCGNAANAVCVGCDAVECGICGDTCDMRGEQCSAACWGGFMMCLNGCTSTYCAPFCQVDLGRCLESCPSADVCRLECATGNGCAADCLDP